MAYQALTGRPRLAYSPSLLAQDGLRRFWNNEEAAALADLRAAVAGDSANAYRWCDLGEVLHQTGQGKEAETCMRAALIRAPGSPQIMARVAAFLFETGKTAEALALSARALARTAGMDRAIFLSFEQFGPGVARVLAEGIGENRRAAEAYLLDQVARGKPDGATAVWAELERRSWVNADFAATFAHAAASRGYWPTASAGMRFLQPSYGETDWVFNGGFESDLSPRAFGWRIAACPGVRIALDRSVRDQGKSSLRLHFSMDAVGEFNHLAQTVPVTPGTYELSARLRTESLDGDEGLRLHLIGTAPNPGVDLWTEGVNGTSGWTSVRRRFRAGESDRVLKLDLVRRAPRTHQETGGTAWVDAVRIARVAE